MRNRILPGAIAAVSVALLAFHSGGYFPSEWGLAALVPTLGVAGVLAVADEVRVPRLGAVLVGALGLLGAWQLLSIAWSTGPGVPALEAERTLVYLCAATLLVLLLDPSRVTSLLAGIVAGVTAVAVYALGTRLLPGTIGGAYDPSSGYQLAKPIGYWNALGLLLVMAIALAAGLALRGSRALVAAASVVLVPLACALYFTFSRGSVLALAVALVVLVLVDTDRLRAAARLAVLLVPPALAVLLASRSPALTAAGATLQAAQEQGHRLAWQLLGVSAAAVAPAMLSGFASARLGVRWASQRRLGAAAVVAVALAAAGALVGAGGPAAVVERAWKSFVAQPPPTEKGLERRLLSVSGNGRADYWAVAARMVRRDPLLGDGAGSFAARWARERPVETEARDAHNLYLETLAELGPVGLALLLLALGSPLLALRRARGTVPAAAASASYAAFLVHAALDWDWEVPLLVVIAIGCASSLLALGQERPAIELTGPRRVVGMAVCAGLVGVALVAHAGNRAVASAVDAVARDDPAAAAASARRAETWMPWSYEPWQLLGEAQLESGEDGAAAVSLRRAVARDPGQWSVWYDLALASRGLDRVNALTRARELSPRSVEVSDLAADITGDR